MRWPQAAIRNPVTTTGYDVLTAAVDPRHVHLGTDLFWVTAAPGTPSTS